MSVLNTAALKSAPAAAINVTTGLDGGAWTFSAWVEVIASVGGNVAIAGIDLAAIAASSYSDQALEFQIGVGASSSEVSIGTIKVYGTNSGAEVTPDVYMLPVPMGGITTGQRVSIRFRYAGTTASLRVGLLYYEGITASEVTSLATAYTAVPLASNGVAVTPNGSAWANSNWFELTSSLATTAAILGVAFFSTTAANDMEIDLGTGAGGAETVITTIRDGWNGPTAKMSYSLLPVPYFLAAGTRVAVRMRKTGTNTTARNFNLLYISGVSSGSGGNAGKGNSNKKGGGGGINKFVPGGATFLGIGNAGVDVGSGG